MLFESDSVKLLLADLSPSEQKRIIRKARGSWGGPYFFVCAVLAQVACRVVPSSSLVGDLIVAFGFWAVSWPIMVRLEARQLVKKVRSELAAMNRCAGCGYDLRESRGTCPECGSPV